MIETHAYDIARDEIVMSSYYSKYIIGSGQKQPLVFYNKSVVKNFAIFTGK